jgi:hypothetical protein
VGRHHDENGRETQDQRKENQGYERRLRVQHRRLDRDGNCKMSASDQVIGTGTAYSGRR